MILYSGKTGHIRRDCKGVNVGNKANGSGTKDFMNDSSNSVKAFMPTSKLNDSILWHARLGHVHVKRMEDMSKDGLIPAFDMNTKKYEVNEEVTVPEKEVEVEGHKREGESLEKEITKKQKIDDEAEELKSHLQIVSNDDVYIEDTPLASKILFLITRFTEYLESLWKLVKERFEKTEPKNYTDDYLLKTLKTMFEQPDVEVSVWRDQKGRYGLAK
nr:zinc finger, CCHC-type [Tanacetum cinerariifolium]